MNPRARRDAGGVAGTTARSRSNASAFRATRARPVRPAWPAARAPSLRSDGSRAAAGGTDAWCLPSRPARAREAVDERQRGIGDVAPACVDRERVTATLELDDLGNTRVALLALEGGVRNRPRNGVVVVCGDDQQRPALGIL